MAYMEVRKDGKLVSRRPLDPQEAQEGCVIHLEPGLQLRLAAGQSRKVGRYKVRVLEGLPPQSSDLPEPSDALKRADDGQGASNQPSRSPGEGGSLPTVSDTAGRGDPPAGSLAGQGTAGQEWSQLPTASDHGVEEEVTDQGGLPQIEGYRITGKLSDAGGQGTVWRAVQLGTHREVALKLLRAGVFSSKQAQARFEREVELTASLEHPNIARVYESGLHHGVHYYAMELIDGLPLDEYVGARTLTQRQVLELTRIVCQAVQYAHQRGVIHRDLKPSNILVTADGQPHVLDFGLAKTFLEGEPDVRVSVEGDIAGTPAYMSPEQAAGRVEHLDTRTDVYSLGVILYQLLTGRFPHDMTGTRLEVLRRSPPAQGPGPGPGAAIHLRW